ncbi:MAG: ABC transporter ATP-binding protein, partial [Clostridia bacterium]|nr:ABC transporter ATP-binding protein [Clostridia bacterium]
MKNKMQKKKLDTHVLSRVLKFLFKAYPVMVPVAIVCIVFSAIVTAIPAIFLQRVTATINESFESGLTWELAKAQIIPNVLLLVGFYVLAIIAVTFETQLAAFITQGFLNKLRQQMFSGMQNLPIKYFDTHKTGDIMSYYTNDIDTLRQLVSQSFPTLIRAGMIVATVFVIMFYYSVWLSLVVILGVIAMIIVSKVFGGGSARYFRILQDAVGKEEGYIQEMMNGQKVVKVFCHEKECQEEFDKVNENLYENSYRANAYANMLAPLIMNIGNILYVIVCIVGCVLLVSKVFNPSIMALTGGSTVMDVSIIVAFLGMTKQFTGNINQVSQQINSITMAMAGAGRIFALMDEQPEVDDGYVTLVNCIIDENGKITETKEHTGHWAWKHPH